MKIEAKENLETAAGEMHDSEFGHKDFRFDVGRKVFLLETHSTEIPGKKFRLEIHNVEKYNPLNLGKVMEGEATAGVFNDIAMKDKGRKLVILSQDLQIELIITNLCAFFTIEQDVVKL